MEQHSEVWIGQKPRICSECGKKFLLPYTLTQYQYKLRLKQETDISYQCSYTCYEHAKLRTRKYTEGVSKENFNKYVKKFEDSMKAQGKEILHPIKIKDEKSKH